MNNEIEKKLDQLLDSLPKPQYDTAQWLAEDHADEFDRIVSQRRRKTWMRRWSIAAAIVGLICITGTLLYKGAEAPEESPVVAIVQPPAVHHLPVEEQPQPAEAPLPQQKTVAKVVQRPVATVQPTARTMTPIDSLADIVERIEQTMQGVRDSVYMANVEKLIRTDDRLQHLVNQLILEGIIADTIMNTAFTNPQY